MRKLIFSFLAIFLFFIATPVFATTVISPIVEIAAFPGDIQKGILKVYNETDQEIFLEASIEPFALVKQQANLLPAEKEKFLNWIKLSQSQIKLLPKQAAVVPFEVIVPESATPGGYYGVAFWQEKSTPKNNVTTLKGKVGTLIFLRINGELKESILIKKFGFKKESIFAFGLPFNFSADLENNGNIHLWPKGEIVLKNIFGQTKRIEILNKSQAILPGDQRKFETIYPGKVGEGFLSLGLAELKDFYCGPIQAQIIFSYGVSEKTTESIFTFWVLPWRAILILAIIILLLIFFFYINRKVNKLKKTLDKKIDEK